MGAARRGVRWAPLLALCLALACEGEGEGSGTGGDGGPWDRDDDGGDPPVSLSEAQAVAVRASTCTGEDLGEVLFAMGLVSSLPMVMDDVPRIARCAQQAADCPAVLACFGYSEPEGPCDGGSVCVDDRTRRICAELPNGKAFVQDLTCSGKVGGDRCVEGEEETACGTGTCDDSEPGADEGRCEDGFYVDCEHGIQRRMDCAALGLACRDLGEQSGFHIAGCLPEGEPCTRSTCAGDTLHVCEPFLGLELGTTDCAALDPALTCVERADGAACGVPDGEEACEPETVECDGAAARYCQGGFPVAFDCASFLGGTCVLDDDGNARCKAPDWP